MHFVSVGGFGWVERHGDERSMGIGMSRGGRRDDSLSRGDTMM